MDSFNWSQLNLISVFLMVQKVTAVMQSLLNFNDLTGRPEAGH
jgi:hypothetical protein